jgi:hypothetical protein
MKRIYLVLLSVLCCAMSSVGVGAQTTRDGEFLFKSERYSEAYDVYVKLMNRQPKNIDYKYKAGLCLFKLNRYEESLVLLDFASKKGVIDANFYLYDIYMTQYKFEEAANVIAEYIDKKELADYQKEECQAKLIKANQGASMLDRVEDIAIIDSVKITKTEFLQAYRLSRDFGKLDFFFEIYGLPTAQPQVVYYTGRGDKMLFAREASNGGLDLNVSYRLVDGWSVPAELSSVLNTYDDENYPFEMSDGVTLYFASKGHNSLGGYDIFMTRYNTTIKDYSEPINIGMPFNSSANDYMYVFDEMRNIGWFATDRYQDKDTVVVYEFLPNKEKVLIKSDDIEYRRQCALLKVFRKAQLATEEQSEKAEVIEKQESEINFFVNDGIVYTLMAQFKSEEAKVLYVKAQEADKRLLTLNRLLDGKRREFFFSEIEEDKVGLKLEILELEKEIRRYKELFNEYILQTRREELKALALQP